MYHCKGCGSPVVFDIRTQRLHCAACDGSMSVEEAERLEPAMAGNGMQGYSYTCPNCGGSLFSTESTAASFCSFCGSSVMLEERLTKQNKPDRIIPFRVTKEQCIENYREYIKGMFCVDKKMLTDAVAESFRGIYIPYCNYRTRTQAALSGSGSVTRGNKSYIYDVAGNVDTTVDWALRDLSTALPDDHCARINEFSRNNTKHFLPGYLAGFYADTPDVHPDVYRSEVIGEAAGKAADTFIDAAMTKKGLTPSDRKKIERQAEACTEITDEESVLLPVWFMSVRYRGRVCYAMVNGVTGRVTSDLPVDRLRFLRCAAIAAAALFVALNFLLNVTLKPRVTVVAGACVLAVISILVRAQTKKMVTREGESERLRAETLRLQNRDRDPGAAGAMPESEDSAGAGKKKEKKKSGCLRVLTIVLLIMIGFPLFLCGVIMIEEGLDRLGFAGASASWFLPVTATVITLIFGLVTNKRFMPGALAAFLLSAAGSVLIILNPPQDILYYAAGALMLLAGVWCELDMISAYNHQCSSPMPVFDTHQGGDDRA
ncbi:MAG: hypothetical protein Q4G19_07880 [Clostridia bacterium]|nr:hypothetical protein [Clostridia bacterium]